jgi:hypothetical protein
MTRAHDEEERRSMNARVWYMVRAWVSPHRGERYLRCLEHKHMHPRTR